MARKASGNEWIYDAKGAEHGFPLLPTDSLFNKPMRQIVEATEKTLGALAVQNAQSKPQPQKLDRSSTPKIFIANVPDTLKSFKKQLINEIGDKATILDDLPPPFPASRRADQAAP